jgi:hypothetical protein
MPSGLMFDDVIRGHFPTSYSMQLYSAEQYQVKDHMGQHRAVKKKKLECANQTALCIRALRADTRLRRMPVPDFRRVIFPPLGLSIRRCRARPPDPGLRKVSPFRIRGMKLEIHTANST